MLKRIIPTFFLLGCGFMGGANASHLSGSESFTGSEPTMSPRISRTGIPAASCSEFGGGDYQYKSIDFMTDSTGTLTVTLDPRGDGACGGPGTTIFASFHGPSFNPANICSNHLWNFGFSFFGSSTQNFPVPPNSPVSMIVGGTDNAPNVVCGPFNYEVYGVKSLADNLASASDGIKTLMQPDITGLAQKNLLTSLLGLVKRYADGPYRSLAVTILNSVMVRLDGCALRGTPDTALTHGGAGMDFVNSCASQAPIHASLNAVRFELTKMPLAPPPLAVP